MKRFVKVSGIILGLLVIAAAAALGYFGFLPGVSNVFGSNNPIDLGVTHSEQDRLSGRAKTGWQVIELSADTPAEESLGYSGQVAVDAVFTNAELTAWANDPWTYYPLSDAQIRVNDDGTLEASGRLHVDQLRRWTELMGVSEEHLGVMDEYLRWFAWSDPPFYVKMSASVSNGRILNPQVYEARLGKLTVPASYLRDNIERLVEYARWQTAHTPGFSAETVELVPGGIRFTGTMPATVERSVR